ncbi:MAG: hypothetical protein K2X52_15790 [Mycobacteriaceae bacterium]|nr:hypothetical protein [Mycobacteriaceae bacterium]
MNRNIFKLTLIGAAFGAMAVAGAGTALADAPQVHAAPAPTVFPFVDFDDVVERPFENAERNFENFGNRVERQFEVFD